MASRELPPAVLTFTSARDGIERIGQQLAGIPDTRLPAALRRLMSDLHSAAFPSWPQPQLTLCRVDPNLRNFIRRPEGYATRSICARLRRPRSSISRRSRTSSRVNTNNEPHQL